MGQKINAIAFRAGHNRKWNEGWYALGFEWKKIFFYQRGLEQFFQFLFHSKIYTKLSRRRKILLFDIKLFKYLYSKFFVFILFYRMRTHRRKDVRPITKTISLRVLQNRKFKASKFRFNRIKRFSKTKWKKPMKTFRAFNLRRLKTYKYYLDLCKFKYFKSNKNQISLNSINKALLKKGYLQQKKLKKATNIKWKKKVILSILDF
jgi:hypothetical protein